MFGQPRCREWTPLATQQLRLRSLIQIVGYNIRPPEGNIGTIYGYYYTLHVTTMSAPFYTSERIMSPHPKWREIESEVVEKQSSNNVVIRIWCQIVNSNPGTPTDEFVPPTDMIISTWGVYFSGLRLIGSNSSLDFTPESFKPNTLVFQMYGGYFCSYKSVIPEFLEKSDHNSYSSNSSKSSSYKNERIKSEIIPTGRIKSEFTSVSLRDELAKSQSPPQYKQNFARIKSVSSSSLRNDVPKYHDDRIRYEHSPDSDVKVLSVPDTCCSSQENSRHNSHIDLSVDAENYEKEPQKYRFLSMKFLNSEIRPSYDSEKLQRLHLLQYSIKKRKESVEITKQLIYKKSALSLTEFGASGGGRVIEDLDLLNIDKCGLGLKGLSMERVGKETDGETRHTLKLNDLLTFKTKPSPVERSRHIRLTKQLELLRFRKSILIQERDSKTANIRRLKEKRRKLLDANQDKVLELLESYHALSRCIDTNKSNELIMRHNVVQHSLNTRRCVLLQQLNIIFPIHKKPNGDYVAWWECDGGLNESCSQLSEICNQVGIVSSYILGKPLSHAVTWSPHLTVYDVKNDIHVLLCGNSVNESMLCRGVTLSTHNVTQLSTHPVAGPLPALHDLLHRRPLRPETRSESELSSGDETRRVRSTSERARRRPFNRFKECTDGICRSHVNTCSGVLSTQESNSSLIISPAELMGSESYIKCNTYQQPAESNASETQDKVVFTLGDDTCLKSINELRSESLVNHQVADETGK